MLDHKIDKIFGVFFWMGLLIILVSFFYDQWFVISIGLGIVLMLMGLIRKGVNFKEDGTPAQFVKKNKGKMVRMMVLALVLVGTIIYLGYAKLYNVKIQFYSLTTSPLYSNWWVFVILGLIIGVGVLALWVRLTGMGAKPVPRSYKKTKGVKQKKNFFIRIIEKLKKGRVKVEQRSVPKGKVVEKKLKHEKKQLTNFYKLITLIAYFLSVISLLVLLVLNRKARIPYLDLYGWITLILLVGLFASFSFLKMYRSYRKKHLEGKKGESETIKVIKKSVIAKASRYKTDIDRLYELVNQKGKLTLSEVSEGFGITKEMAEEWGKILEEHNLIKLNYPPFGELELCKK